MLDFLTQPLASLGSGLMSSVASFFGTQSNNQAQQQMQQQQEAYNTQMSNTAYQRATADMKAAGLNPMMMFGSGSAASTPSAPPVTLQSPLAAAAKPLADSVQSAVQTKVANATVDRMAQEVAQSKVQALNIAADTSLKRSSELRTLDESSNIVADTQLKKAELPVVQNRAQQAENVSSMNPTVRRILDIAGYSGRSLSDVTDPVANLVSSARGAQRMVHEHSDRN